MWVVSACCALRQVIESCAASQHLFEGCSHAPQLWTPSCCDHTAGTHSRSSHSIQSSSPCAVQTALPTVVTSDIVNTNRARDVTCWLVCHSTEHPVTARKPQRPAMWLELHAATPTDLPKLVQPPNLDGSLARMVTRDCDFCVPQGSPTGQS